MMMSIKNPDIKAVSHRDSYAPKRIFSRNTATKNHGRRQPCHDFLFCLAEKPLALECFAVLSGRFLPTCTAAGRGNTGCILRPRLRLWGKRFGQNRMNPYGRPPNCPGFRLLNMGVVADMVLTVTMVTAAAGTVAEFKFRMARIGAAANSTFVGIRCFLLWGSCAAGI